MGEGGSVKEGGGRDGRERETGERREGEVEGIGRRGIRVLVHRH